MADEDSKKEIKASQLPIYDDPNRPQRVVYIEENRNSMLYVGARAVRKTVGTILSPFESQIATIRRKWAVSKAHTASLADRLQTEPIHVQKGFFIIVAGLGGMMLARNRSVLTKGLYGTGGAVVTGSLCYSTETTEFVTKQVTIAKHKIMGTTPPEPKAKPSLAKPAVSETKQEDIFVPETTVVQIPPGYYDNKPL